ncbi:MAG: DUF362 domain-containing protein [Dehalococcoidales bacterium]
MKPKVALTRGKNRTENIDAALELIDGDIDLKGKSDLFIKVNFVSTSNQLAATHVDGVRGLLAFLRERYTGKITIGESTLGPARDGFERYGYLGLEKEFGVKLVDLNQEDWKIVDLYDKDLGPMPLHFSRRVIESDYRISIGPSKTHDTVIVTLSLKNLSMGGLSHDHGDKRSMHQGYPVMNLNLYILAKLFPPHLSVIDGFTGMEGEGPGLGDPVDWGVAVASCDPVAADSLTAHLMGFNPAEIGYLWYCHKMGLGVGDIGGMDILGADPADLYHKYKPHPEYEEQKQWHDPDVEKLVEKM